MLVHNHHEEVHDDHQQDERRNQQDVEHVQAADDHGAGELAAEEEERDVGADDRDGLDHAVDDAQAVAGEQVIGERVAGEAGGHGQDEQDAADHPVELARLAERAGEEHAEHVHGDGGHEQQRRPVVHLAHEQAAADIEGDVQGRAVGHGHLDALQRHVRARVVRLRHGRIEEERQERAREQQDDEGVQRHFAEHEGPVVREDLPAEFLDDRRSRRRAGRRSR